MATHNHSVRIDTHRAMLVDEACADEDGKAIDMNERQGRGPVPKVKRGPKPKSLKAVRGIFWTVVAALGVALAWHFLARGVA